jgi:hypothetical protein
MKNEKSYTYYRNKRIPSWWVDYLPEERNPYKEKETLTLEKGCLDGYWLIYSSNKYPNARGVEACNFVHGLVRERFGGAFLTNDYGYSGGAKGVQIYHEPEHLVYENAYIGEDKKIHIKNAKKYYEDVIRFVMNVLGEIAKNHMQSGIGYNADEFFPHATDQEIEKRRIEAEKKRINTSKLKEELIASMKKDDFCMNSFACGDVVFNASYDFEDGWFNVQFAFDGIKTNLDSEENKIKIVVDFPSLYHAERIKKDRSKATKELELNFCFYLERWFTKDTNFISIPIAADKVSDGVKARISELCNTAMEAYNETHMDMIENTNCKPVWRSYPYNIFLDNKIGRLKLVYKEGAGMNTWRYRGF